MAISWIKMQVCSQVVKLNVHPLRKEKEDEKKDSAGVGLMLQLSCFLPSCSVLVSNLGVLSSWTYGHENLCLAGRDIQ
jgi:hypothetical protein